MNGFLATLGLAAMLLTGALGAPVAAQQPFAAAATVNGQAITNFQVQQRALFFGLLRAPGADTESATQALIDETLQNQAARAAGIALTEEELDEGMVEFAGRANLSPDQFIAALAQGGVEPETFRDFVRNGMLWRSYVQQRFGPVSRPSDAEIDRKLARGGAPGVRVLLSEIALPLTPETAGEVQALAQRLSDTITTQAGFEAAARQYSRSNTAQRGGRLDWLDLSNMAPPIAEQVLTLAPGQVSDPVNLGSFIGLFILRDLDENAPTPPAGLSIDYAEYLIPGGRTPQALEQAGRLRARVDVCDDLYGVAREDRAPEGTLRRETRPVSEIPADLRQELAKLDAGEASMLLAGNGYLRFVMLCGRDANASEDAFRTLGQQLLNQRLTSYSDGYLEELRADAVITR